MNVLIGCEYSATVRDAFLKRGHNAFSCDLLPCEKGPRRHYQQDIRIALKVRKWDLFVVHPECTHLCGSGARWWPEKRADGRQQRAIDFFIEMMGADVDMIAAENPVGILSSAYRKPDQIIQPYQFGHMEMKTTCLWLKNLPPLAPTHDLERETKALPPHIKQRMHHMRPSPDRWKERSRTYQGIAEAMAEQWGSL